MGTFARGRRRQLTTAEDRRRQPRTGRKEFLNRRSHVRFMPGAPMIDRFKPCELGLPAKWLNAVGRNYS